MEVDSNAGEEVVQEEAVVAAPPGPPVKAALWNPELRINTRLNPLLQETERNKLVFFEGSQYTFDLEDLLRASAEVMGKGSVGTAYKGVLEDGTTVVVKRLKDVAVDRRDFEQRMELVGRIRHRNLVPLRAFYFSKDEKVLVYDYMPAGSLSALLHGSRGSGRTPLDWETRMRIVTKYGPLMRVSFE